MKKLYSFILFLLVNAACLFLSNIFMGDGPTSDWYYSLERAPWTPPSWAFGVAWSFIMICFAAYMALMPHKRAYDYAYYCMVLSFCALWNYAFFNHNLVFAGFVVLCVLTMSVLFMTWQNVSRQRGGSWLMLPFCVWTIIATSLNAYSL
ncbi:MAG: tryptophan-rich sensory protein [Gammaproteobacteria bacterium]|nr:tryptophan-rich sensory protein [Gammaproteobacteria bacterium]